MKQIDFLPTAFHEVRRRRRRARHDVLCCLATAVVLLTLHEVAQTGIRKAEASLTGLRSTRDRQSIQQRVRQLQQDRSALRAQAALLDRIDSGIRLHELLSEVTRTAAAPTQLTSLSIEPSRQGDTADPVRLVLGGVAASDLDVGVLCGRLSSSSMFDEVLVRYSRPAPQGKPLAREFEMTCTVRVAARPGVEATR